MAEVPAMITLTLTFDPTTGQFGMGGVPDNLVIAMGLLAMAQAAITNKLAQNQPSPSGIVVPQMFGPRS